MATFVSMATCHACNTTSRHKGMNRDFIAALAKTHGTPASAGKHKTPQSANRGTPKTPGKDKTPSHTPRGSTSSTTSGTGSTSSSKSSSKPKIGLSSVSARYSCERTLRAARRGA